MNKVRMLDGKYYDMIMVNGERFILVFLSASYNFGDVQASGCRAYSLDNVSDKYYFVKYDRYFDAHTDEEAIDKITQCVKAMADEFSLDEVTVY